jgi:hypothetical protein
MINKGEDQDQSYTGYVALETNKHTNVRGLPGNIFKNINCLQSMEKKECFNMLVGKGQLRD